MKGSSLENEGPSLENEGPSLEKKKSVSGKRRVHFCKSSFLQKTKKVRL
jgi:hypothetical protein